jgi:hypothetical protein
VYQSQPHLPTGVSSPEVTIVGQGRLSGNAVVDLEAIGKRRSSGGALDPWSLVGGRVPVSAEIAGLPVPPSFLQELLSYYSRTPERPQGVRLDDTFSLPANIRQIEVGQGQAVVVQ